MTPARLARALHTTPTGGVLASPTFPRVTSTDASSPPVPTPLFAAPAWALAVRRGLRAVAGAGVVLAAVIPLVPPSLRSGELLLLLPGGSVLVAGHVGGWSLVVAAVALCAGALVPPPPQRARLRRTVTAVGVLAFLAVLPTTALTAFASSGYRYTEVPGPADAPCRVVVSDEGFFFSGAGRAYVVDAGGRAARAVASYSTDDGYAPFAAGEYTAQWDDAGVTLGYGTWGPPSDDGLEVMRVVCAAGRPDTRGGGRDTARPSREEP